MIVGKIRVISIVTIKNDVLRIHLEKHGFGLKIVSGVSLIELGGIHIGEGGSVNR